MVRRRLSRPLLECLMRICLQRGSRADQRENTAVEAANVSFVGRGIDFWQVTLRLSRSGSPCRMGRVLRAGLQVILFGGEPCSGNRAPSECPPASEVLAREVWLREGRQARPGRVLTRGTTVRRVM